MGKLPDSEGEGWENFPICQKRMGKAPGFELQVTVREREDTIETQQGKGAETGANAISQPESGRDDALANREMDQFGGGFQIEFFHQAAAVIADRLWAQAEIVGDRADRTPLGQ